MFFESLNRKSESVDLAAAVKKAKRVYVIGNGGSFANASHIANDLQNCGVKAHSMDPAILTAWANDFGFEMVFYKWINLHGEPGDFLLALSGSGTSENILLGLEAAKEKGMDAKLITWYLSDFDMQESEEAQLTIGHKLMKELRGS
jgi:D-sedoheptulose 7-phosphate isomerase